MINYKKHKGISFYDVAISLVILVIASLYITKIFVETTHVSENSKTLDTCIYQTIETVENIKAVNNVKNLEKFEYFEKFNKVISSDNIAYSRDFVVNGNNYSEIVLIKNIDNFRADEIKVAEVYNDSVANDIVYQENLIDLYRVSVQVLDDNNEVVYDIETFINEKRKVVN